MKFYNREKEIDRLREIQLLSRDNAQFTVLTGRRRVGKTQLLLKATEGQPTLYFFVSRKAEPFLCEDFELEIADKLQIPILGNTQSFSALFKFLMQLSATRSFNLIIDEFQEFLNINPSVYSDMQRDWDILKSESRMNLLVCGSVHSLMHKIFEDYNAPLFGRATNFMRLKPFNVSVLRQILSENHPDYTTEDLLGLYTFTGGVAKYVQLFVDNKALSFNKMLDFIIQEDASFIADGKSMLIEEFGKDYAVYFTILSAIAQSENTRAKIETIVGREIGGYLTRMENDYGLISKRVPVFSKSQTKNVRYVLDDNYLTFWFRFIYKYSYMIEIRQFDELRKIVERDYATFSGKMLEKFFREKFIEQGGITNIGGYWDKSGENEIDLIVVNDIEKTAKVIEIKRKAKNIRYNLLKEKTANMLSKTNALKGYAIDYLGLSMDDMEK
ncbi:MAG: ATP-binding protein [Porphyromonadaceae bacterium]|jgi:AAA+ ATPase superfamily predicted ATPase|nr:ATP-binding protein [Porphyromonadaceae bacterium]